MITFFRSAEEEQREKQKEIYQKTIRPHLKPLLVSGLKKLSEIPFEYGRNVKGVEGVFETLKEHYKNSNLRLENPNNLDDLADRIAKSVYHHAIQKFLDTNIRANIEGGSPFVGYIVKDGMDISDFLGTDESLEHHADIIESEYSEYLMENMRKFGYKPKQQAIPVSISMDTKPNYVPQVVRVKRTNVPMSLEYIGIS